MAPPEHALVLCCDEKSQVQALDRTQPGLPLKKGRAATLTHDYKRNGTTTLFAALNVLDGQVIGQCQQRHTHAEWLKFLKKIDRETPKDKTLHLIADNYATHKHPVVQEWLGKHPRFVMHFTPTSASWLNMVERFFRNITTDRLCRGVFTSVPELIAAIDQYIAHHNADPKPFIWTKSARDILQKVIRANSRLSSKQNAAHDRFQAVVPRPCRGEEPVDVTRFLVSFRPDGSRGLLFGEFRPHLLEGCAESHSLPIWRAEDAPAVRCLAFRHPVLRPESDRQVLEPHQDDHQVIHLDALVRFVQFVSLIAKIVLNHDSISFADRFVIRAGGCSCIRSARFA